MRYFEIDPNTMLLSGVMIGAFFSAAILVVISFLNESLKTAVYWLMGNLSAASPANSYPVLAVSMLFSFLLAINSQKYNVLALGDESARHLGVNTVFIKNYTYVIASVLIGVVVSVSGIIGFVGLLIPHICRMIFGVDNRKVIPGSFFLGAIFLTICDTVARTAIAPSEIPVGAVTSFFGAPLFIYLLRRGKS
jgi:iron complex transport system permease protein